MTILTNSGITIDVPENEVDFYIRAGYVRVGGDSKKNSPQTPPVVPTPTGKDLKALAKIAEATSTKDLYAVQDAFPNHSQLVEDAMNAKGQELMAVEEAERVAAEKAAEEAKPK